MTAKLYARIYLSLGLGVKVRDMTGGEESGRAEPPSSGKYCGKKGCFLYGNHTLPQGDVFIPVKCRPHHRIYTVVSAANLGIPVLGRLLPMLGAIPVPDSLHQMAAFRDAVCERVAEGGCVVIYPEAHVWPYYTGIRPFERGAFSYPAETGASCYCSTVTYQKHRWRRRPAVTVWLDGPFYPDMSLKKKQRQRQLEEEIHACMCRRSKESSYEYIRYEEIKK
ncbi:MAG: lysophospholipid acyltransferase family protein [Anaerovoracaceae bacterium]